MNFTMTGYYHTSFKIAWSADSRLLVSGSADSTLKVSKGCLTRNYFISLCRSGSGTNIFICGITVSLLKNTEEMKYSLISRIFLY